MAKTIGHTTSGKPIYAAFQLHRNFADWTANDHHDAAEVHRSVARTDIKTNEAMHKNSVALHEDEARRIYKLVEKLGLASRTSAKKSSPQHATIRRSGAQLDREIAEVLAKKPGRSHATKSKSTPSWEQIAADYKSVAKAAREAGGKVKIYPDGSILVVPTEGSDEYFYQDWQADEFRSEIERNNRELLDYIRFEDLVLAQSQHW